MDKLPDIKGINLPKLLLPTIITSCLMLGLSSCKFDEDGGRFDKGKPGGLVIPEKSPTPTDKPQDNPKENSYLPTQALTAPKFV